MRDICKHKNKMIKCNIKMKQSFKLDSRCIILDRVLRRVHPKKKINKYTLMDPAQKCFSIQEFSKRKNYRSVNAKLDHFRSHSIHKNKKLRRKCSRKKITKQGIRLKWGFFFLSRKNPVRAECDLVIQRQNILGIGPKKNIFKQDHPTFVCVCVWTRLSFVSICV